MPPLPLNLDAITNARTTLADQVQAQRSVSADHQQARAALDALRRSGADAVTIAAAEARDPGPEQHGHDPEQPQDRRGLEG